MTAGLVQSVERLAAEIPSGATIAVMKDPSGAPIALARALLRRGVRDLHLICVPTGGLVADILIGAGAVRIVEGGGVALGEYGQAPSFVRAVKTGRVRPLDTTCPAVYSALQAGEKGIPFMPMRGLIGSDILRHRAEYRVAENPFARDDPVVLIPALRPDAALIHAPLADGRGNVWIGRQHELKILAHAAKTSLVTVEALFDGDLAADPLYGASMISALYVGGIALAPRGAAPLAMAGHYEEDRAAISAYAAAAATEAGFAAWLKLFLADRRRAAAAS